MVMHLDCLFVWCHASLRTFIVVVCAFCGVFTFRSRPRAWIFVILIFLPLFRRYLDPVVFASDGDVSPRLSVGRALVESVVSPAVMDLDGGVVCSDVVVEGIVCADSPPPIQHTSHNSCVVCGDVKWGFGGLGVMWSCGGCCAFLPFLPLGCPASNAIRDTLIHNTPMYCGVDCQDEHWFGGHHEECRRDDESMYAHIHVTTPALHNAPVLPVGRRVVRDGVVVHVPSLVSPTRHVVFHHGDGGGGRLV